MDQSRGCRPGEHELKVFRQSRIRLYLDLFFVLIAFLFIGVLFVLSSFFQLAILFILIVIAALVSLAVFINWYFTVYVITSVRVEYRSGIISKVEEEICLEDIQTVDTQQDIIGRIFDHGDIKIEAAGLNTIILKNVHHAHRLAHEIANLSLEYNKKTPIKIPKEPPVFSV